MSLSRGLGSALKGLRGAHPEGAGVPSPEEAADATSSKTLNGANQDTAKVLRGGGGEGG